MKTQSLVLFARPPALGSGKTRLSPVFTPQERLFLHRAMLLDAIDRLLRRCDDLASPCVCWDGRCAPDPELDRALEGIGVEYQRGEDLGLKMAATMQDKLRAGFERVVIIGSDAPDLPFDYVREAFAALGKTDVVLGPATDGGYYLIGCRRMLPNVFRSIPWGGDRVLAITRRRIRDAKIDHHELPVWRDIDTPSDARALLETLRHRVAKGKPDIPERTFHLLARLIPGRL